MAAQKEGKETEHAFTCTRYRASEKISTQLGSLYSIWLGCRITIYPRVRILWVYIQYQYQHHHQQVPYGTYEQHLFTFHRFSKLPNETGSSTLDTPLKWTDMLRRAYYIMDVGENRVKRISSKYIKAWNIIKRAYLPPVRLTFCFAWFTYLIETTRSSIKGIIEPIF